MHCVNVQPRTFWFAMSSLVGGWCTTKKRGRDDATIERDRMEVIARRKELFSRNRRRTTGSSNQSAQTKRGDELQHENVSSAWVKPPCGTPLHRKHRLREPISQKRELFPKEKRKKKVAVDCEIRTARETRSRNDRHNKRCGSKTIKPIVEKQKQKHHKASPNPSPASLRVSKCRGKRAHKQSTAVVTPEQECEESRSYFECQTKVYRSKRRRSNAKVLPFGDEERVRTTSTKPRFSTIDSRKRHYQSSVARNNPPSKLKQKKSIRKAVAMNMSGFEPDFARSARYLYETIRRPKKSVKQNSIGFDSGTDANGREANLVAGNLSSAVIAKTHPSEQSAKVEPKYHGAHYMAKTPKTRSERQFELVRNLLLGNSLSNIKHDSVLDPLEEKIQSPRAREAFRTKLHRNSGGSSEAGVDPNAVNYHCDTFLKSSKEKRVQSQQAVNNTIGSSETVENANKRSRSHELQQLSTQQEHTSQIPHYNPLEQVPDSPKTVKAKLEESTNDEHQQHAPKRSTLAQKNTNAMISSHPKKAFANNRLALFTQQEENCENDSPSRTPSTASSAMLSLPMNYQFSSSSQPSFEGSKSSKRDSIPNRGPVPYKTDESAETIRREKEDPLRDIRFWQRIVEREETRIKNSNGRRSFKHTIASLVLVKNSSTGVSTFNHANGGFLWLPSILEGGVRHTGFLED